MLVSSTGGLLFVFNRNFAFLALASIITISLFYLRIRIKQSTYYSSFLALLVIGILFAINYVFAINPQSLTKYIFFGITIFTTVLVLFYYNNQSNRDVFIDSLYFILKLILIHSLFNFFAYFLFKDNLLLITSEYHESLTYNYLFYYSVKAGSVINLFGLDICRNSGIFWEPGILQVYLNILFFLEISVFKRQKKLLVLIIAAILSTYSTTGLLLLMIQVIYFLQKAFQFNLSWPQVLTVLVLSSLVLSIPSAPGMIGTFHAAVKYTMVDLFAFSANDGNSFAILMHAYGYILFTSLGAYYFMKSQFHDYALETVLKTGLKKNNE